MSPGLLLLTQTLSGDGCVDETVGLSALSFLASDEMRLPWSGSYPALMFFLHVCLESAT